MLDRMFDAEFICFIPHGFMNSIEIKVNEKKQNVKRYTHNDDTLSEDWHIITKFRNPIFFVTVTAIKWKNSLKVWISMIFYTHMSSKKWRIFLKVKPSLLHCDIYPCEHFIWDFPVWQCWSRLTKYSDLVNLGNYVRPPQHYQTGKFQLKEFNR